MPQGLRVRVSSCPPYYDESKCKIKKKLHTILVITVAKSEIKKKFDERISKAQKDVSLKGFRPGKVPISLIKKQFGKALYGEVLDLVLEKLLVKLYKIKK